MLSIESISETLDELAAKAETPLDTAMQLGFDPMTEEAGAFFDSLADYFHGDAVSVGIGVILGYVTALRTTAQLAA